MSDLVAPCGHPGERVIGAFVRCLKGCDGGGARANPQPALAGHVQMCACEPCQVTRRGRTLVLRADDGTDAWTGPWGGEHELEARDIRPCRIAHWQLRDEDGVVIASNILDVIVRDRFEKFKIQVDVAQNVGRAPVTLQVQTCPSAWTRPTGIEQTYASYDPSLATGKALDDLARLSGLSRHRPDCRAGVEPEDDASLRHRVLTFHYCGGPRPSGLEEVVIFMNLHDPDGALNAENAIGLDVCLFDASTVRGRRVNDRERAWGRIVSTTGWNGGLVTVRTYAYQGSAREPLLI